jgi:protein-S-isoprenylcysteine O-methyltransferase Ste14
MGRALITFIFGLIAAAVATETVELAGEAVAEGTSSAWLAFAYSTLKLAVALAFMLFVLTRGPALRRTRDPVAYVACAAAIIPVALQTPTDSAAAVVVLAGEVVALVGCAMMLVAAIALGRCFGVLPEARGLVTHGPYSLVRHPLYLGEFTAMGGLLIASPSPRNLGAGAVFVLAQTVRMRLEERALTREFPEYAHYAALTPRVLPSWQRVAGELRLGTRVARRIGVRSGSERPRVSESGQTLLEYALVLSLVSIGSVTLLTAIGLDLAALISGVAGSV